MKIYNLGLLVEPKETAAEADIINEILQQLEKDGQQTIVAQVCANASHQVVVKADLSLFPNCLSIGTNRLALAVSLPTKKDLGRRWFLKRLEGANKNSYLLIAMTDVTTIHIEADL